MSRNKRVLIVGAKFGEVYLNSFLSGQPGFELCGLLAKGSPRAHQLAKAFGIPLYTAVEQLPDRFDVACVVVRSTVVGGAGSILAEALLRRGIHVIQEHPLHPNDLARLQALAASLGLLYWVNSFYSNTAAGRCWISAARTIRFLLDGAAPSFAHITTSRQLLYSCLDLLLQATGQPVVRDEPACLGKQGTFDEVHFSLPDCHVSLKLQNYMDDSDPDQHNLVMHHCQLGWPSGYLTLAASYGPVIWIPSFFDHGHQTTMNSMYNRMSLADSAAFLHPTAMTLHSAPDDWKTIFEKDGPDGVSHVLGSLLLQWEKKETPPGFQPSHQLAVAMLWQQTLRCVGAPRQYDLEPPRLIDSQKLLELHPTETLS